MEILFWIGIFSGAAITLGGFAQAGRDGGF